MPACRSSAPSVPDRVRQEIVRTGPFLDGAVRRTAGRTLPSFATTLDRDRPAAHRGPMR